MTREIVISTPSPTDPAALPPPAPRVPYALPRLTDGEVAGRAAETFALLDARRSVRRFSPEPVPRAWLEHAIRIASTAPSGAHRQPWTFVCVGSAALKKRLRAAVEAEEHRSYEGGRMTREWRTALAPIGTDWHKPYLEVVPWVVVVFEQVYGFGPDGRPRKN